MLAARIAPGNEEHEALDARLLSGLDEVGVAKIVDVAQGQIGLAAQHARHGVGRADDRLNAGHGRREPGRVPKVASDDDRAESLEL